MPLNEPIRRALFVELLGGIGDLVFVLPSLDALVRRHPEATWDVLTFAPGGELLLSDPRVHEVFFARRGPQDGSEHPACWHDLAAILEQGDYDLIVSDTRHSDIHLLVETSPARRKVTQLWSGTSATERISRLFLRRLQEEGLVDDVEPPARLCLRVEERRLAEETWAVLNLRPERTVVLNPHAGVRIKRWSDESYVELGRALALEGWRIVVLEGECLPVAARIAAAIPHGKVLPRRRLRVAAACLENVALFVSGDSGLAHVASAVGTPVLGLYGPTSAGRYGVAPPSRNLETPFDCPERNPMDFTLQRCWAAERCVFADKSTCCDDITPAWALEAARSLLSTARPPVVERRVYA